MAFPATSVEVDLTLVVACPEAPQLALPYEASIAVVNESQDAIVNVSFDAGVNVAARLHVGSPSQSMRWQGTTNRVWVWREPGDVTGTPVAQIVAEG